MYNLIKLKVDELPAKNIHIFKRLTLSGEFIFFSLLLTLLTALIAFLLSAISFSLEHHFYFSESLIRTYGIYLLVLSPTLCGSILLFGYYRKSRSNALVSLSKAIYQLCDLKPDSEIPDYAPNYEINELAIALTKLSLVHQHLITTIETLSDVGQYSVDISHPNHQREQLILEIKSNMCTNAERSLHLLTKEIELSHRKQGTQLPIDIFKKLMHRAHFSLASIDHYDYFSPKIIINNSLIMLGEYLANQGIRIHHITDRNIPALWGDKTLHLRIITSLIHHIIEMADNIDTITLISKMKKSGNSKSLIIDFKGYNHARSKINKHFSRNVPTKKTNPYAQILLTYEHIIELIASFNATVTTLDSEHHSSYSLRLSIPYNSKGKHKDANDVKRNSTSSFPKNVVSLFDNDE